MNMKENLLGSIDEVDAYVEQEMRRLKIPGVALAIVEGDQIVHLRSFGHARSGGEVPSPQTPFVLGSTTKSFTALAAMQLVEAGKIDLDDPIQRYLPWFRVADPEASAQMIVRQLLNQTSGLPMLPGMIPLADLDDSPGAAERQARALASLNLNRSVGSAFEYSNLNYNLLGLIIEAVSGESYTDYIQHCIFDPLEMKHSYTSQAMAKQNGLAVGHRYWFAHPFAIPNLAIPRGSLPSGQLISSAEDMAHYLIAHLNEGRYKDVQILSPAGINELHCGVAEYRAMGMTVGKYGMGWFFSDQGQTKLLWHGGNVPDFSSFMALLPEQKKGVVLLVNADHYGLPPVLSEVGLNAAALLAGQQPAQIKLGFIPWAMRALLLIPLLQIIGVVATLLLLRQWHRDVDHRPSRGRAWRLHILPPLIPNLSLAALPLFLQIKGLFRYLLLYNPDVAWIALICGGFAGIWTFLRTGLILNATRKPKV
jgi:CubicO group peptidase (beta-lactamase class C family)